MIKKRSFLKWAGGKYASLHQILPLFPQADRLVEPFAGGGSIFMNTHYNNYLLAEANRDLINLFQYIQKEGLDFINYCAAFFIVDNNNADAYTELRDLFNCNEDARMRAALFLYLNRHGFNGLCRYNQKGGYNVPFGLYKKPYFPREELLYFHTKSQKTLFVQNDFRKTFEMAQAGDVIYCDPPYVPLSDSANFASYTGKKFVEQDHKELAELARFSANSRQVTVLISNHDTPFTRDYYQEGDIFSFPVFRYISGKGDKRQTVNELIAVFKP